MTIASNRNQPVFQTSRFAELLIETLLEQRRRGYYKLHAYLVMADQVHLLITPDSLPLGRAVSLIQTGFARRLGAKEPLWQEGFIAHSIRNLRDLEAVRAFLHRTPVRIQLTSTPEQYPYSSARRAK